MKQYLLILFLAFALGCAQRKYEQKKQDNIGTFSKDTTGDKLYTTTSEDSGMNNAIDHAKMTLDLFDKALKSGNKNYEYFSLKKRFAVGENGEHIWISSIQKSGDGYKGIVNNDPELLTEIKYGDTVFVSKEDITDWMYLEKNVLCGGYTLRLELKRMDVDEKARFLKNLDYKIVE